MTSGVGILSKVGVVGAGDAVTGVLGDCSTLVTSSFGIFGGRGGGVPYLWVGDVAR